MVTLIDYSRAYRIRCEHPGIASRFVKWLLFSHMEFLKRKLVFLMCIGEASHVLNNQLRMRTLRTSASGSLPTVSYLTHWGISSAVGIFALLPVRSNPPS